MPQGPAESLAIVSPHLDDAVLSCGHLLAQRPGAHVVTVFSSGPDKVDPLPWWDQMCGVFRPGDDVMAIRREEDAAAMDVARAHAHHLGFWDEQYRGRRRRGARLLPATLRRLGSRRQNAELASRIEAALRSIVEKLDVRAWLIPLGLHRGDHELVAGACLGLVRAFPDKQWWLYEELPYRSEHPEKTDAALDAVRRTGLTVSPIRPDLGDEGDAKAAMVRCYRSQLGALDRWVQVAIDGTEVFHELSVLTPADR